MSSNAISAERRFLALPTWIRERGDDAAGAVSIVEQVMPLGFESPWHVHNGGTETFYVIDGEVTVIIDGRTVVLGPGDSAYGPPGVPHGFRVSGEGPARMLLINNRAAFSDFILDCSEPAETWTPAEPDFPALAASAARHGMEVLGPIPA